MRLIFAIVLGVISTTSLYSEENIEFRVDFGANPPPHSSGVPDSGALLADGLFSAAIYLSAGQPASGRIVELGEQGRYLTVFDFPHLVYAAYPLGGTAFSYEGSWSLAAPQIQDLMEGEWYAQVSYADSSYLGRILPVPEPSGLAFLAVGSLALTTRRKKLRE